MKLGWLKKRFKSTDRTWWYIGYATVANNRMECCGMIYTLTTPFFVLPAIQKDLDQRLNGATVTILSWQQLGPTEGANLAKYFDARKMEAEAKVREGELPKAQHLSLVRIEDTEA